MKKLRTFLATIIARFIMAIVTLPSILLCILVFVIVGDKDEAYKLIADAWGDVEHWLSSRVF